MLTGVDGGASSVCAHEVIVLDTGDALRLELGAARASARYESVAGLQAAPIDRLSSVTE